MSSKKARVAAKAFVTAIVPLFLANCAGYTQQTQDTLQAAQIGNLEGALTSLESHNTSADKDLLYYMEKGELLNMKGDTTGSRDAWMSADQKVLAWEDQVKTDPSKLLGDIGSVVLNDTTRRYDGRDYEKVLLNANLALDNLQLNDWDTARVEIKKMHEREAVIADFHEKEIQAASDAASEKGLRVTSYKDLNGYPVETLDDPEVQSLTNSYESAAANYVAGFIYEAEGDNSLAAPGYRKAIEMRPGVPLLEQSLAGLDKRMAAHKSAGVDTLFVIESGSAPTIVSRQIPIALPIPGRNGVDIVLTPISFPVMLPNDISAVPPSLDVDGQQQAAPLLTNVDVMARRALRDEMPAIIARSSVRAISRGIAQKAIDDNAANAGAAGLFISLAAKVATVATEVADERIWRSLPGFYSVARVTLPEGVHHLSVSAGGVTKTIDVTLAGKYALVTLRLYGANVYMASSVPQPAPAPVVDAGNNGNGADVSSPSGGNAGPVSSKGPEGTTTVAAQTVSK